MSRRKITVENAGTDAIRVRLLGDPKQPEPQTLIVTIPGGEVEITRTTDDRYWVHVRPWTPEEAAYSEGAKDAGSLDTARVDYRVDGGLITDGAEIGFDGRAAKVAVLLGRPGRGEAG